MRIEGSISGALESVSEAPGQKAAPKSHANTEPSLMPNIAKMICTGDPGAMFAALTMQTAKSESDTSRKMRDAALSAQAKADDAAVQDIHDKANLQRWQGVVDGALQIGEGVCDVGMGINEAKQVTDTGADQKNDKLRAAWLGGGSTFSKAAQSIAHGVFQGAISDKDADEKMHEASSATFKRIADDAHDNENDAKALLNKAIDFYKEYVDTKNQTAMAAIHRA